MQEARKESQMAETEKRVRALFGGILDRRKLFDALNALVIDASNGRCRCEKQGEAFAPISK